MMNDCSRPFESVTRSFIAAGFRASSTRNEAWNAYWASNRLDSVKSLSSHQKTNHFHGCWNLGRKDLLWQNLSRQQRQFPEDYSFLPRTFLLAAEYDRFAAELVAHPESLWILKPVASSCGRGVHLAKKKCRLPKEKRKNYLASKYVSRPHLINGLKYDLRVYVLVTSFDPLRVYVYNEGLVRFATEKYDMKTRNHQARRFMHLTNYSVNKKNTRYVQNNNG